MPDFNKDLFVKLPAKSNLVTEYGKWCVFINDVIVPEDVLEEYEFIVKRRDTYARKEIAGKLRLLSFWNKGSRRYPKLVVDKIYDARGNLVEELVTSSPNDEQGRKMYEKYAEYCEAWRIAKRTTNYTPMRLDELEPEIEVKDTNAILQFNGITVKYNDRGRYKLVKINAHPNIKPLIEKIVMKYGFERGQYGGYIMRAKIELNTIRKMLEEIKDTILANKDVIEDYINEERKTKYMAEKKEIEQARQKIGITKPAEQPITKEDVARLLGLEEEKEATAVVKEEEKVEDIDIEEIDIESLRKEWGLVKEEEKKKETREEEEEVELTPSEVRRIAESYLRRRGLIPLKVVVFTLPTEYLKSKTKLVKEKDKDKYIEQKELTLDPSIFRSLRTSFYKNALHKVAWKSEIGWVLYRDADLTPIHEHIARLNEVLKKYGIDQERFIDIIEVYAPKDFIVKELTRYIRERKTAYEEIARKIKEEADKLKNIKQAKRTLEKIEEELRQLERELRYIQTQ